MSTSFLGKVLFMPSEYDPETWAKAVRPVREHCEDYPSEWAATIGVATKGVADGGRVRAGVAAFVSMTRLTALRAALDAL
jgi:hypothetical protein